jgi:hypothetical protein
VSGEYFEEEEFSANLAERLSCASWTLASRIGNGCRVPGHDLNRLSLDAFFTFLGKRIIDDGIMSANRETL